MSRKIFIFVLLVTTLSFGYYGLIRSPDADRLASSKSPEFDGSAVSADADGNRPASTNNATTVMTEPAQIDGVSAVDPDWASSIEVPPNPASHIPSLLVDVERGSHAAADELFMHAWRCAPWQAVPRTPEELSESRDRIIQRRQSASGRLLENQDNALAELEKVYALCEFLSENEIQPHTYWVEVAADLGSHQAMVRYWTINKEAQEYSDSAQTQEQIDMLSEKSVTYLERARDDGYVDAFFAIAASKAGLIPGPYTEDYPGALAHLYAESDLRIALIERRIQSGIYDRRPDLETFERARLDFVGSKIEDIEQRIPIYQHREARKRSQELVLSCCK